MVDVEAHWFSSTLSQTNARASVPNKCRSSFKRSGHERSSGLAVWRLAGHELRGRRLAIGAQRKQQGWRPAGSTRQLIDRRPCAPPYAEASPFVSAAAVLSAISASNPTTKDMISLAEGGSTARRGYRRAGIMKGVSSASAFLNSAKARFRISNWCLIHGVSTSCA